MPDHVADTVDLCGGPGGWDVAARSLGLKAVGIELDDDACATRRAAGLPTVQGSVRDYGPADFPNATGGIASPPCPTFSRGGKGSGRRDFDMVEIATKGLINGEAVDVTRFEDERTALVLEPLRWALEACDLGRPFEWLAFEQVSTVLPIWEQFADVLRAIGYSVATGNLQTEQFGIPQTRTRAILVARLHGAARIPAPTHSRFHGRTPEVLDEGLPKWVSMSEALGWPLTDLVGFPRRADTQASVEIDGVAYRARDLRSAEYPAQTVTEKARSWSRFPGRDSVSLDEAAALQTFPPAYPWHGAKTSAFHQVGNAIPPKLARAILSAVLAEEPIQ
jgi:DNA (cytosine-5)-methyltransferase 1